MRSSRIKQNHGRYCVDRVRTKYDIWGVLAFFFCHVLQVTLLVVVIGVEIVSLWRRIIATIVRLWG